MSAYNSGNGTWAGDNKTLLTTILRDEWGFRGTVISDFVFGLRTRSIRRGGSRRRDATAAAAWRAPCERHARRRLSRDAVTPGRSPNPRQSDPTRRPARPEAPIGARWHRPSTGHGSSCGGARCGAAQERAGRRCAVLPLNMTGCGAWLSSASCHNGNLGDTGSSMVDPPSTSLPPGSTGGTAAGQVTHTAGADVAASVLAARRLTPGRGRGLRSGDGASGSSRRMASRWGAGFPFTRGPSAGSLASCPRLTGASS